MKALFASALLVSAVAAHAAAPTLADLEGHLQAYQQGAIQALGEGASCLEQDQQRWMERVRRACKDDACRGSSYRDRLAELHALQPGVSAIRYFELPRRPELVWIVPPAADQVAAPANAKAVPAQVEGVIVDEVATGDGFVLRTAAGERYLLAMLMFVDGATAQRFSLMSSERDARFLARGYLPAKNAKSFEPSRCLFVHRLTN
jgi:uncharacterized protein